MDWTRRPTGRKWTTLAYDGLDRVVRTTYPDGQYSETIYAGVEATAKDPAGFQIKTWTDALGRTVQTVEPNPSTNSLTSGHYETAYQWTAPGKLKTVTQGAQTRSFVYDGLGRLTAELHPEWGSASASNGTASYQYDANSNLTQRTDAKGTVVSYAYDDLNRPTSVAYSDGTPAVSFSYDSTLVSNGKRRRTGMGDGVGSRTYHYDSMGRVSKIVWSNSAFPGGQQTGEFVYNLDGGVKESRWPGIWDNVTPLTIYWAYDASGRQREAWWSNLGATVHQQQLVDGHTFDFVGSGASTWAEETVDLPNGTVEMVTFNDRMQPRQRKLTNPSTVWELNYDFTNGSGKNNGEVWGIDENSPGYTSNRDQNYGYDWLRRIKTGSSPGQWGLSFAFDRYGNRTGQTATSGSPPVSVLAFNQSRNRITTSGSNSYDNAGNLLGAFGKSFQYDAENRIKTVNSGSAGTYSYDGDGRRAKRVGNGETRHYFHDPEGNPIWEYETGVGWEAFNLYFNGRHLAVNNTTEGLRWRHQDHLGSLRVKTDSTGAVQCRYWYYPYGELWNQTCSEADVRRFTDKERDPESGLDYFGARYYASQHGRFTSVDPALESGLPGDPQTWNRYAYVGNRPTLMVDPDGRTGVKCDACGYSSANEAMAALPERLAAETEEQRSLRGLLVGPAIVVAALATPGPDDLILGAALSRLSGAAKLLSGAKRAQILENAAKGRAAEEAVAAELRAEGKTILGSQVSAKTSEGRRVIDHLVDDGGKINAVEVKSGNAARNVQQVLKDKAMASRGATLTGKNAPDELRGTTLKIETTVRRPKQ